jgi:Mg-chelatase subunit ChlD
MRMATERRRKHQRGMAIFFYATMLIFVVGCVGLAVDVGTIYMIRARLVAAVDAAALAAGRSVNLANTVQQATTNATTTATQFFNANFPANYFNSIGSPTVTPTFTQEPDVNGNPNGVLDIQVTASVSAPTYFMNIFNVHSINVTATGTASRRGVVLMLVLDQSSSMGNGAGSSCEAMVAAAQNFVSLFSPFDQIGLVKFDITAHLVDSPTTNLAKVSGDIAAITCGSNTNTISALELAYQQIKNTGLPLALNTIVLFTDGSPNGVTAAFPARAAIDSRWGSMEAPVSGQAGSTFGINNNCNESGGSTDPVSQANTNAICINMPAPCANPNAVLTGTLAQWGNQDSYGGDTYGLASPMDGVSVTGSCPSSGQDTQIRQFIAYIPDKDVYGNDLHGIPNTGPGPTVANVVNDPNCAGCSFVTRDYWLFQVPLANQTCSPDSTVQPNCKSLGDLITNYPNILKTNSNFFPQTNVMYANANVYANKFRPDQPNTVVAAGMNGTMAEALKIRGDTTYHPVIHTIYLTGNSFDSVDREFLAIVANAPQITPLPYDAVSFNAYANPAYQTSQETGKYLVTANKNSLTSLFAQLASEVLRLSH